MSSLLVPDSACFGRPKAIRVNPQQGKLHQRCVRDLPADAGQACACTWLKLAPSAARMDATQELAKSSGHELAPESASSLCGGACFPCMTSVYA